MYAVMGITGQVGSVVAEALLARGKQVRAIVRDPQKAAAWAERGVEMAAADYDDAVALETAFRGIKGVFVMIPPNFAPLQTFVKLGRRSKPSARRLIMPSPRESSPFLKLLFQAFPKDCRSNLHQIASGRMLSRAG
jgi:uncharacterized protein YbjT (DUF2867 family)